MFAAQVTLPYAFADVLAPSVREVFMHGFDCVSRVLAYRQTPAQLDVLLHEVAVFLTLAEARLPRIAMSSQMHALYHLVETLQIWGPAHGFWEYPLERYQHHMIERIHSTSLVLQNLVQRLQVCLCASGLVDLSEIFMKINQ